jgi:hypothetical protein
MLRLFLLLLLLPVGPLALLVEAHDPRLGHYRLAYTSGFV